MRVHNNNSLKLSHKHPMVLVSIKNLKIILNFFNCLRNLVTIEFTVVGLCNCAAKNIACLYQIVYFRSQFMNGFLSAALFASQRNNGLSTKYEVKFRCFFCIQACLKDPRSIFNK